MGTNRNRIMSEGAIMRNASVNLYDETVTKSEKDLLVDLFDIVDNLVKNEEKVSLLNISKIIKIKPSELEDYIGEILQFEQRSILRYSYST